MRALAFTKMHGTGNDYVYMDCTKTALPDPKEVSVFVSDIRFGIGSDGLILIQPPKSADALFTMAMYNADGSEGAMCGNGIRCFGKYVYDKGLTDQTTFKVDTKSGQKTLVLDIEDGVCKRVTVDMGAPIWEPARLPVDLEGDRIQMYPYTFTDEKTKRTLSTKITCVSMGNPHCVMFNPFDLDEDDGQFEQFGPIVEKHALFPDNINAEFVNVIDDHTLRMRVWERGSNETFSCGTGACAVTVAAVETGVVPMETDEQEFDILVRGGKLSVIYNTKTKDVFLKGPAEYICEGTVYIPF